ncbi:MAG: hypothetical protein ACOX1A_07155 [Saccharofermentanales bacterium]|jgi:hypothetical protein|nr:hypothetical protein [Clostridiaceae bacterium]
MKIIRGINRFFTWLCMVLIAALMLLMVAEMSDGRVFTAEENFMVMERYPTREELVDKFRAQFNAFGKLPKSNGEKIIELAFRFV